MIVNYKSLREDAIMPEYGSNEAAGMDLYTPKSECVELLPGKPTLVKLGFSMELPTGYHAEIRSRSGLALKTGITVLNGPGTIDSDYRGEIGIILFNHLSDPITFEGGSRLAQMVVMSHTPITFRTVEELSSTDRNSGGYGSTGV